MGAPTRGAFAYSSPVCIAVYVATGKPFDPVPWTKDAPAFHTEEEGDVPAELRARFEPTAKWTTPTVGAHRLVL